MRKRPDRKRYGKLGHEVSCPCFEQAIEQRRGDFAHLRLHLLDTVPSERCGYELAVPRVLRGIYFDREIRLRTRMR